MPVKKGNIQVCITLSEDLVLNKIDKDAEREVRSRSKQIAKIVQDHYRELEDDKD